MSTELLGFDREPRARQRPLTKRQSQVLGLVAGGLGGSAIARRLSLSPETIKSHVQNAMIKLGARTRAHAVAIALTTGQIGAPAASREPAEAEADRGPGHAPRVSRFRARA